MAAATSSSSRRNWSSSTSSPARLIELLVLSWRQKSSARAQICLTIGDLLERGLPSAYDKTLFEAKRSALFEHVYESYPERDVGVYAIAGSR